MATLLDKDLVRESIIKVGEREIVVTIGADQSITMKLKGMKTGAVSISIENLYKQLAGTSESVDEGPKVISIPTGGPKKSGNDPMMSLHDIRHRLNVSNFDYPTTVKFDGIMKDLIDERLKSK